MMVGHSLLLSHPVFSSWKLGVEPPLLSSLLNWLKAISPPVNPLRRNSPRTGPVVLHHQLRYTPLFTSPVNLLRRDSSQTGPVSLHRYKALSPLRPLHWFSVSRYTTAAFSPVITILLSRFMALSPLRPLRWFSVSRYTTASCSPLIRIIFEVLLLSSIGVFNLAILDLRLKTSPPFARLERLLSITFLRFSCSSSRRFISSRTPIAAFCCYCSASSSKNTLIVLLFYDFYDQQFYAKGATLVFH